MCGPVESALKARRGEQTMAILESLLDTDSEQFAMDREAMLAALQPFEELAEQVRAAGGETSVKRHRARG